MGRASYTQRNKGNVCQHRQNGYPWRPDYTKADVLLAEIKTEMAETLERVARRDEVIEMTVKELAALAKSYGLPRFHLGHRFNGQELCQAILEHEALVD